MVQLAIGILLGGVWVAAGTWVLLPKDLRRAVLHPPRFTWIALALFIATAFVLGTTVAGTAFVLVVPVTILACPAIPLLGMAQTMRDLVRLGARPGMALGWTMVAVCATGLALAGFGLSVFFPILWIPVYAAIHVLAFARGWRTPQSDRVMTALSFGIAVFWFSLPMMHETIPHDFSYRFVMQPDYVPDCRSGFPFRRILGSTRAAAAEYLRVDKGLYWMYVNAACSVVGAWLILLPVPRRAIRELVFPALVTACVGAVAGEAYMLYILD